MGRIRLLDGGMGRELKRAGAPFRQPEWSALALIEAPHFVAAAHAAFIAAGADIITTNSYAVVPFHLGEARFDSIGRDLAALAGRIARSAADRAGRPVAVAGSLPPALGSYRPDRFDRRQSLAFHRVLIEALDPYVDNWLAETQSSIDEARAVREALGNEARPLHLSYTLDDGAAAPMLRSGEPVADAVGAALELGVAAILFNCSQPEVMAAALAAAGRVPGADRVTLGAYANAFPPMRADAEANATVLEIRTDLDPARYAEFAAAWIAAGAAIVGGCCGIGPEHIAALRPLCDAA